MSTQKPEGPGRFPWKVAVVCAVCEGLVSGLVPDLVRFLVEIWHR